MAKTGRPAIDHTGERHGKLTVIRRVYETEKARSYDEALWLCKCDCGRETVLPSSLLKNQRSCNCFRAEAHKTHGKRRSRLYEVWSGIKKRCYNENATQFKNYGGRGVKVCDEWMRDFSSFYSWAINNGYDENAPRGKCTIDRIDNNGNYSPDNCRIVTQKEQCNNTRRNVRIEWDGETKTLAEWSDLVGLCSGTISHRYKKGKRGDELFAPPDKCKSRKQKSKGEKNGAKNPAN